MPTLEENLSYWSSYGWPAGGDEWSVGYGGTASMWAWTLQPRLGSWLPADHVLELAPGYGRVTQYLVPACRRLTLVDLAPRCIEACRERFRGHAHVSYHVNDGRSLGMVPQGSVDLALSWDSLIHVERDVIVSYVEQLARLLRPGGVAFLHHSNLGAFRDSATGALTVPNEHWRASTVSAALVRETARGVGLAAVCQELVPWGGAVMTDCVSLLRRPEAGERSRPTTVVHNHRFFVQAQQRLAREVLAVGACYRPEPAPALPEGCTVERC